MQTLNIKDLAIALNAFRTIEGRNWKCKLRDAWETGNWGSHKHYVPLLQSFRNRGGPDALDKIHWALAQDEIEKLLSQNIKTNTVKLWVRVGIEIEMDPNKLDDNNAVIEAIRNGTMNGECYAPCDLDDDEGYANHSFGKELDWDLYAPVSVGGEA